MQFFYIVSTVIFWFMHVTVGAWLLNIFPQMGWKWPVVLSTLLTAGMIFGMSYTRTHFDWQLLYYVSYAWMGIIFLAFSICVACAVCQWVLGWFHVSARAWLGPLSILLMFLTAGMAIYGGLASPKIKRIPLTIPNAPKMKLALLSDSHLGMGVSLKRFDKALQTLEREKPDALLALGDIFEYGPHREQYAARLAAVPAPLGKFGVMGNHEIYVGYGDSKEFFKNSDITLLEYQIGELKNGVQVAGILDAKTAHVSAHEVEELLHKADPARPLIFLSHTPMYAEEAARAGADMMFSGHTHNGQIFPFKYLVYLQFPRVYGLFDVEGMKFYITSGMFYWGIPLRFLAPSEIPIIEVN